MALSLNAANQNATTSRILNKLNYAMANVAEDIGTATTSDILLFLDASDNYEVKYGDATNLGQMLGTLANAVTFSDVVTFQSATNGLVAGSGSSSTPHELGSTAGTALDFRFRGSHTTGDMRGMYLRLDLDGTAASAHGAEALRAFTEIEDVDVAVGGTVNAIHATMEIDGNTGNVDGAGNVIRATLGGSGTKTLTGTLSGLLIDLDLPSAVTLNGNEAAIRIGKAQDHEWPVAIAFDSTVGANNAIQASDNAISGNASHAIHIKIDGVSHYIAVWDNATFT